MKDLDNLNKAINQADDYQRLKRRQIDSLIRMMNRLPDNETSHKCKIALDIAERFRLFNADSALYYSELGFRFIDDNNPIRRDERTMAILVHTDALSSAGVFIPAQGNLKVISKWHLTPELRLKYWESMRILYGYMRDFYEQQSDMYAIADRTCEQYDDSLLSVLPPRDVYSRFLRGERFVNSGQHEKALVHLLDLLDSVPETSPYSGKAAYQIARIYLAQGDHSKYVSYLARSAKSDIMGCVREGMALPTLADWMWKNNETEKAYNYVNFALQEAIQGNARIRTYSVAKFMPKIDMSYRKSISESHNTLLGVIFISVFLVCVLAYLIFILIRQNKRTRSNEAKLTKISKMQENYLANFVALSSSYATRFDSLTKIVGRKLSSGQADELLKLINSGKLMDTQDEDFHTLFDSAFNDLYPNFTDKVNELLREEDKIILKSPGTLTPELRIYALVRLGIDESIKIAQILNYSVSTVYAYRNRMRNKAINRESFDEDVRTKT